MKSRELIALVLACSVLLGSTASAQGSDRLVLYEQPVNAYVIDQFRPPAHIGARGNRGLEYGTVDGMLVVAAADGVVAFAGHVAGRQVITLEHTDGVRTTYTGLIDIWVGNGDTLKAGTVMASSATGLHFGARVGQHYVDPQILLDASEPQLRARLLPPN